jgi:DNA-binding transcriptional MocR family regulator
MHEALTEEAPAGVTWTRPQGGFYFWCRFPDPIRQSQLLARAAEQCVSYLPGDACFPDEPGANHLRLNFTFPPAEEIRPGVARLMGAMRAAARRPGAGMHQGEATPPIV